MANLKKEVLMLIQQIGAIVFAIDRYKQIAQLKREPLLLS